MSARGALALFSLFLFVTSACTTEQGAAISGPQEPDSVSPATDTVFGTPDVAPGPADTIAEIDGGEPCQSNDDCALPSSDAGGCQIALCDMASNTCVVGARKDFTPCDDGDLCSVESVCQEGVCVGTMALACDDGNPCTDDSCDSLIGCAFVPNEAPCDDGNSCTTGDTCQAGICAGAADAQCSCQVDSDCLLFEDEDLCNGHLACVDGACVTASDSAVVCPEATSGPCHVNVCDPGTGLCAPGWAPDGEACSDGNPCTSDDTCAGGSCLGQPSACACEDDVACAEFDDGDLCNGSLVCVDGLCVTAEDSVVTCPPAAGACEAMTCDPSSGACLAVPQPDGTGCDDGDACTQGDGCLAGTCAGQALDCGDGGPCLTVSCDPTDGCLESPVTGPCDDGDACTTGDSCVDGACAGTPWLPAPALPCTVEICDAASGPAIQLLSDIPCDDGDPCTTADTCLDGICVPGATDPGCAGADCCEESGTAGCGDPTCEALVCAEDAFCCEEVWDDVCVESAALLCPACGPAGGCGDGVCGDDEDCVICAIDCGYCEAVCGDGLCEIAQAETCATCEADCGPCTPGDCCEAQASPGCDDADCEALVCAADPFCCDGFWDSLCAETAVTACESCDGTAPPSPTCGDGACEGDEDCVSCPTDCGPCAGSPCCEPSEVGGCADGGVEACTCAEDDYCCDFAWDPVCVEMAVAFCGLECETTGPLCGDGFCDDGEGCEGCPEDCGPCGETNACCDAGAAGLCPDALIVSCTCFVDSACCEEAWTDGCVEIAQVLCGLDCDGGPGACGDGMCTEGESCINCPDDCGPCGDGSCCTPTEQPGCEDAAIADCVCADDPFCCEWQWDELCVEMALSQCALDCLDSCGDGVCTEDCASCPEDCGPCESGLCCVATLELGCPSDPELEACVCAADPFCCESSWDTLCANGAAACGGCPVVCGDGACVEGDEDCASCPEDCGVCPFCGDGFCDEFLSGTEDCGSCPEDCGPCSVAGDCCTPQIEAGCGGGPCEEVVCDLDPYCCETMWDTYCVGCAIDGLGFTGLECSAAVPVCGCGGDAPMCGDGTCDQSEGCADCPVDCGVCPPICGDGSCDGDETCLSCLEDCGACVGDCCVPHNTPGCESQVIYECVCEEDASCCEGKWTEACVALANDACFAGCDAVFCGDGACAGDEGCHTCAADCGGCEGACCEAHDAPGCDEAAITSCVCDVDAFCCQTGWDVGCAEGVTAYACGSCDS